MCYDLVLVCIKRTFALHAMFSEVDPIFTLRQYGSPMSAWSHFMDTWPLLLIIFCKWIVNRGVAATPLMGVACFAAKAQSRSRRNNDSHIWRHSRCVAYEAARKKTNSCLQTFVQNLCSTMKNVLQESLIKDDFPCISDGYPALLFNLGCVAMAFFCFFSHFRLYALIILKSACSLHWFKVSARWHHVN